VKAPPEPPRVVKVLEGLDEVRARLPAREVLRQISWEGPRLDPEITLARDFLAAI
jgi:hypothetical protein